MIPSGTSRRGVAVRAAWTACAVLLACASTADAQTLRGSRASVERMFRQAEGEGLHFYQTSGGVRRAVANGTLVPLRTSDTYVVSNVRYPYVRPEARLFVERLSAQYRQACGERLVVTSATRPHYYQRRLANGSARSVHPTGMAIDLRRPSNARCLAWLRRTLLALDRANVIEAIEERRPPHFHVAVFPTPYRQYVDGRAGGASGATRTVRTASRTAAEPAAPRAASGAAEAPAASATYVVRRGDTLWGIARSHRVGVADLRTANRLRSDRLVPGQRLSIPGRAEGGATDGGNTAVTYRVRSGDTLWAIARRHSLTVEELKRANTISSSRLRPGQELTIPAR